MIELPRAYNKVGQCDRKTAASHRFTAHAVGVTRRPPGTYRQLTDVLQLTGGVTLLGLCKTV